MGYWIMAWGLASLGGNYQQGGSLPRATDEIDLAGPYRFIRHPMYSAALMLSPGLACLVQALANLGIFCVYLVLILGLIPVEEEGLRRVYGEGYGDYQQKAKKLIPFVY